MNINKRWATAALLVVASLLLANCSGNDGKKDNKSAEEREKEATDTGMKRMTQSQPIPVFDYSVQRQTLIEVETMQAQGTYGTAQVTTIDGTLLWWCPTLGAPIPATYQLSNPWEAEWRSGSGGDDAAAVTARAEPTGVYTGDSAATWIRCTDDAGTPFVMYDEAQVRWTSGVLAGLPEDKRARVDEITFEFSTDTGG